MQHFSSVLLLWALAATASTAEVQMSIQITANPTICDSVKQTSGFFKLTDGLLSKNYFFWFFESRSDPVNDPVVMWLTGGPGCSSEVALFGENGPCTVNEAGTNTSSNPYSWNSNANLLYVDQPTGTGFSYGTGEDHDEVGVAADLYNFLAQFFKEFSTFRLNDFFIFGESYAGHYVPAISHKVWQNNQNVPAGSEKINLKGISIGNGLTDPEIQYAYYPEMIISTNQHKAAVGNAEFLAMKAAVKPCVAAITQCQTNTTACLIATDLCNLGELIPYTATGMNPYDMRIKCAVPPLCYDFSNVAKYLAIPSVQQQLGVTGKKWSSCNRAVSIQFEVSGDWMHDYQQMIPDLLASDIEVLIYAGDQDYICNWLGNQAWALALDWPGKATFNAASPQNWTSRSDNVPVGHLRHASGFSFLQVYGAGHMVPRDQPVSALAMLNSFINGTLPHSFAV